MEDYIFEECRVINQLILEHSEDSARDRLIRLLDYHAQNEKEYTPLVNHLIRELGLYPYMHEESSLLEDRYVYNLAKVDVGQDSEMALHLGQYELLRKLVEGKNIAVSAPTSFGKSFVIDAFIKIRQPMNVMIIVPTIALMDETRRRIYKKFSGEYNIVTTGDAEVGEKNIFIFPQERALGYANRIDGLDMLIVDEFYKSSSKLDKERSQTLIEAIIKLGIKAKQKYYLAPNISQIKANIFTEDMEFLQMKINTVCLQIKELYKEIGKDKNLKGEKFKELLRTVKGKSLIYAGSYTNIETVSALILTSQDEKDSLLLQSFADWIGENYDYNWPLTMLIRRGCGEHNGQLHRALSQIQIQLFEQMDGLDNIISTSSIIEGVNTSAENVIVWMTTGRGVNFSSFSYKNLIGRAGRMFRHFIGNIYLLAQQPEDEEMMLEIDFPPSIEGNLDIDEHSQVLTDEQVAKIKAYDQEMTELIGEDFKEMKKAGIFQTSNTNQIKHIAEELNKNKEKWECLRNLDSEDTEEWTWPLKKIIRLISSPYQKRDSDIMVEFIKIISDNWHKPIPELLEELQTIDVGLRKFFKLEREVSFNIASLVNDLNILQKKILRKGIDLSKFYTKLSCVFLPPLVYVLEEYGLPRMISRKIQNSGVINFEEEGFTLQDALEKFREIGREELKNIIQADGFENYIIDYFYDGITR